MDKGEIMNQIVKRENGIKLDEIKNKIDEIILSIRNTDSKYFIKISLERMAMAREFAKIQKKTEELYESLLRIEIECFKKIIELDILDVLNNMKRTPAKWWAKKTDEEINCLIEKYRGMSSLKIYRQANSDHKFLEGKRLGESIAQHRQDEYNREHNEHLYKYTSEYIDEGSTPEKLIKAYNTDLFTAIAVLLDDYATKGESFTVAEMADDILLNYFSHRTNKVHGSFDEGLKKGIRELCRKSIMKGKTFFIVDKKTPKFVTCHSPDLKGSETGWMRIPFENATLKQFDEMISLRKVQLEQDKKALENLIEIYSLINEKAESQDGIIGDIIIDKMKV